MYVLKPCCQPHPFALFWKKHKIKAYFFKRVGFISRSEPKPSYAAQEFSFAYAWLPSSHDFIELKGRIFFPLSYGTVNSDVLFKTFMQA